jgi:hypothetical protein
MSATRSQSPASGQTAIPADGVFDPADVRRLAGVVRRAREDASAPVSTLLPGTWHSEAVEIMERHCTFAHSAMLLFPVSLAAGLEHLADLGFSPFPTIRSVLVRRRVSERYGLIPENCDIHVTRLLLTLGEGRAEPVVELFLFPRTCAELTPRIQASEREHGFEEHTAFSVTNPSDDLLEEMFAAWRRDGRLLWEGGGHNPNEGPAGSTVLYFVGAGQHRFELHCEGDFSSFVARHPVDTAAVADVYAGWRRGSRIA